MVLCQDVVQGLRKHRNIGNQHSFPSTSEGQQSITTQELPQLWVPSTSATVFSPSYATLHRSLHQRVAVAVMRYVLNALINESRGNPISREDKVMGIVCRVKPINRSYVHLLNICLNDTDSDRSISSAHCPHDEDS